MNHAEAKGIKSVSFDSIEIVSGAGIEGEANGHHYQLISQKAYGKALRMDIPKGATLSILRRKIMKQSALSHWEMN